MNSRREVILRLRQLEAQRQAVEAMDQALQELTPAERLVLQMLVICPEQHAAQKLCQILCVEQSSVYRRKDRALSKLAKFLEI